jgi:hypothetical protein
MTANIIIQHKNKAQGNYSGPDEMLISVDGSGFYWGIHGVIRTIIKAYSNTSAFPLAEPPSNPRDLSAFLNLYIRFSIEKTAYSIVHAGGGVYLPVSKLDYEEYSKWGLFNASHSRFIITISGQDDQDGDHIWEITMKSGPDPVITRTIKEWMKFSDIDVAFEHLLHDQVMYTANVEKKDVDNIIKESIFFGEFDSDLLSSIYKDIGRCPCDDCMLKAMRVTTHVYRENIRVREIMDTCDPMKEYRKAVKNYLLEKLSYDSQLQVLLKFVAKLYSPSGA